MTMITAIFNTLTQIATAVVTWFAGVFNGVSGLIFDTTSNEITLFGSLLLIGLGISVVWSVLRLIVGLIRRNPA